MTDTSALQILEQLASDGSRLFKEEVMRQNSANMLLRRVFVAAGDPYVNFYVNKFSMPPAAGASADDAVVEKFLDVIYDQLATRKVTGGAAKELVIGLFSDMTPLQQKWCLRILLRNLRVGASESLVEKTWPGAITKFSVQLAETLTAHHDGDGIVIDDPVKYPVRVEPKLDGLRCVAVKHGGIVTMFTRSGTQLETLPTIKCALEAADYDDFVLDGEIMGADWNESASVVMSRKSAKDDSNMTFHVFDAVHFDDWRDQDSSDELQDRIDVAREVVQVIGSKCVVQVAGKTVNKHDELMKFYASSLEDGYEGIMLKSLSSPYRFKRTAAVLKLKPVATWEGVVVGHYEATRGSKREGMWGGFHVLLPNGVITRVGGGFSDKLKAEIDMDPDAWLGRIVEVEGQPDPLTRDGLTVDGRVRFPVFTRERDSRDVDGRVLAAYRSWMANQTAGTSQE